MKRPKVRRDVKPTSGHSQRQMGNASRSANEKQSQFLSGLKLTHSLGDFDEIRNQVLSGASSPIGSSAATYDKPNECLKREAYRWASYYDRAKAVPELRDYVMSRDDGHWYRWEAKTSAFFWFVRLLCDGPTRHGLKATFPVMSESQWSAATLVMDKAAALAVHPMYLTHFVLALGGWRNAASSLEAVDRAPQWVHGLSLPQQEGLASKPQATTASVVRRRTTLANPASRMTPTRKR